MKQIGKIKGHGKKTPTNCESEGGGGGGGG